MNRQEYLNELSKYLKKLPKKDYEDTMEYFEEYFNEVGEEGEQELIEELGEPRVAATEILSRLLNNDFSNSSGTQSNDYERAEYRRAPKSTIFRTLMIAGLCILAAPIGIPLTIALIAVLFSFFMVIVSLFIAFGAILFAGLLLLIKLVFVGIPILIFSSGAGGIVLIGSGLIILSIAILLIILLKFIYRLFAKLVQKIISFVSRKRGDL